jgi:hypothetical protein
MERLTLDLATALLAHPQPFTDLLWLRTSLSLRP